MLVIIETDFAAFLLIVPGIIKGIEERTNADPHEFDSFGGKHQVLQQEIQKSRQFTVVGKVLVPVFGFVSVVLSFLDPLR